MAETASLLATGDVPAHPYALETVEKSLLVLMALAEHPPLDVAGAARVAGVSRSRAYRILATLEHSGLAARMPGGGFGAGAEAVRLASLILSRLDLQHVARPILKSLGREVRESVNLALLRGNELICIDVIVSPERLHVADRPGDHWPIHATATGRAIAVHLDQRRLRSVLGPEPYRAYTNRTPTTWAAFEAAVDAVRRTGFALDIEESQPDVACAAAPILRDGVAVGGVSITGPRSRLTDDRLRSVGPIVARAALEISASLGIAAE